MANLKQKNTVAWLISKGSAAHLILSDSELHSGCQFQITSLKSLMKKTVLITQDW